MVATFKKKEGLSCPVTIVCLQSSLWSLSSDLAAIPALPLSLSPSPVSLSDQPPMSGRRKQVCFRVVVVVVFAIVVRISCVKLALLLHQTGVAISEGKPQSSVQPSFSLGLDSKRTSNGPP